MSTFQIATMQVTKIESIDSFETSGSNVYCVAGSKWQIEISTPWNPLDHVTIVGDGECPWKVNQKVLVTVGEVPSTEGTAVEQ